MKRYAVMASVTLAALVACSEQFPRSLDDDRGAPPAGDGGAFDGDTADADATPDADVTDAPDDVETSLPSLGDGGDCNVRTASPSPLASPHVTQGTAVAYSSNPPSSGPHYPVWANFQEFTSAVPDGNLVHSLEHGAILLTYHCDPAEPACTKIIEDLRAVRDAIPTDTGCDASTRVRVVIAPRPTNDTAVAAAAWGQTYRADCVDVAGLTQWATTHYAKAPEDFCNPGQSGF